MLQKTIVVVDYNTQEIPRVLESLIDLYDLLLVSFSRLPDISTPVRNVLAIVILCTKPDEEVLMNVMTLRACYPDVKIIVMSPQPTPDMVAQTISIGANNYLDLAADNLRLASCLEHYNKKQSTPSVWSWLLPTWLFPKRLGTAPVIAQNLPIVEPFITSISEKIEQMTRLTNAPPQYQNLIKVQFFGDFEVKINGKSLRPKTNGLLLAYLLYNHNRPIHKEVLMTKFWGDSVNDAKNCLNAAIFCLRKCLSELTPERTIIFQNDYYAINTSLCHVETDADLFAIQWEKSRALLRTQGLGGTIDVLQSLKMMYKDEFLPNFNHEWAVGRRDEFRERHLQALNLLSEHFWQKKELNDCIDNCLDILQVDDCVEPTHRRLMECYSHLKMKDKAVRQYKKCVGALKKLNIAPERETENLYLSILQ